MGFRPTLSFKFSRLTSQSGEGVKKNDIIWIPLLIRLTTKSFFLYILDLMNRRAANRFDVEAVASALGETKGNFIACLVSILIIEGKQYGTIAQLFVETSEQMINFGNLAVETVVGAEMIVFSYGILVCADRRKLPILTTRKHQDKKNPHCKEQCSMQQGKVSISIILVYIITIRIR